MIAEKHYEDNKARENQPVGTPMHRLLRDPYIAIIAGALVGQLEIGQKGNHRISEYDYF